MNDLVLASWLPVPDADMHKYSRGKAVMVAGSASYPGAAYLASCATQLVGAGYTEVFTASENVPLLQSMRPSLVVRDFSQFEGKQVFNKKYPGAIICGSGFDSNDESLTSIIAEVISTCNKPLLIDGGALGLLATKEMRSLLLKRSAKGRVTVLTPHEGEAARLAKIVDFKEEFIDSSQQTTYAQMLAEAYGATIVLKGSTTTIAVSTNQANFAPYVFYQGTPALAKAGTGDVLAGIIGGFLAQGVDPIRSAILGVNLHAKAAYYAVKSSSLISVCAEDVLQNIPNAIDGLC